MRRFLLFLLILVLLSSSLLSCHAQTPQTASFFLMDTVITVTLYTDEATAEPILTECRSILSSLDRLWSRTKAESDVSVFNEASLGEVTADPRTVALLQTALDVAAKTDGAFDVTVAPLMALWRKCEEEGRLPTENEMILARASVGSAALTLSDGILCKTNGNSMIDLGGIGKGAAISAVLSYVASTGVRGGLISFGSNVAVIGEKPNGADYRIALKDPKNPEAYACTLTLTGGEILSVSGDYERFYEINGERYHHILDPSSGYPARSGLSSVAVVCRDGALADALSTAILVMGEERARALYASGIYDFEAVFISETGELSSTEGISVN